MESILFFSLSLLHINVHSFLELTIYFLASFFCARFLAFFARSLFLFAMVLIFLTCVRHTTLLSRFLSSPLLPSRFLPSRFLSSPFLPSRFLSSPFLSSPFLPSRFLSSPFLPSRFLSSPFLPSRFLSSPFLPSRFLSSPFLPSRFLSSPFLSLTLLAFGFLMPSIRLAFGLPILMVLDWYAFLSLPTSKLISLFL